MLTYLLGPILALLPRTCRKLLPFDSGVDWRRATLLSGFGEAVVALVSLMYWYSDYMALLVNNGVDSAITGKMGPRVTDQEIGFTALVIWATHPLTWVITFAGVEGAVRLVSAAFTETIRELSRYSCRTKLFANFPGEADRAQQKPQAIRRAIFPLTWAPFAKKPTISDFQRSPTNSPSAEAFRMNSWKFAPAGKRQNGFRRARYATKTPSTGWRRILMECRRCRSATRCENCRPE